jgi:hypothetical protein
MLNHKKVLSLALATAMAASLSIPAYASTNNNASSSTTSNRDLEITGAYQAVSIAVVVPTSGTVIINPYALPVSISSQTGGSKVSKQIVTKPLAIQNQSEVKLDVNVSATATVKGNLTLATGAVSTTEKKNSAFLYVDLETTTLTSAADADVHAAYANQSWTDYSTTATNVLALKADTTVTKNAMVTLAKPALDASDAYTGPAAGSIAFVGLNGSCAQNPTEAWTANDGVTVKMAFTFTPNTSADTTTPSATETTPSTDNSQSVTPSGDAT